MKAKTLAGYVAMFFLGCLAYNLSSSFYDTERVKRIQVQEGTCGNLTFDKDFNWVGVWKPAPQGEYPTCISSIDALAPGAFAGWCDKSAACSVPVLFKGRQGGSRRLARGNVVAIDKTGTTVRVIWKKGDAISAESPGGKGVLERQTKPW